VLVLEKTDQCSALASKVPGSCGAPSPVCLATEITACDLCPKQPRSPSFCRTHNIMENQFSVQISSLSANWALCAVSQLPCELLGPMGCAHCPLLSSWRAALLCWREDLLRKFTKGQRHWQALERARGGIQRMWSVGFQSSGSFLGGI